MRDKIINIVIIFAYILVVLINVYQTMFLNLWYAWRFLPLALGFIFGVYPLIKSVLRK